MIAWFIGVRPGGRQVHPGSLIKFIGVHPGGHPGSLGCAPGVVGFISGRWVHWDVPWCL